MIGIEGAMIAQPLDWVDLAKKTDEQLLSSFVEGTDELSETAFQILVERLGPMVLGTCRHILRDHHAAEDAFQATFLVLARKAGSIRDRKVLASWLYEVAYRIAVRAKFVAIRRRARERRCRGGAVAAPQQEALWNDVWPILRDEVNRLPEKYRAPVVLYYMEGKTNEEVARSLRWPVGTVKGRLSRARDLLRIRLARHGSTPAAAFL